MVGCVLDRGNKLTILIRLDIKFIRTYQAFQLDGNSDPRRAIPHDMVS